MSILASMSRKIERIASTKKTGNDSFRFSKDLLALSNIASSILDFTKIGTSKCKKYRNEVIRISSIIFLAFIYYASIIYKSEIAKQV
jgi:hypothetical protein